MKNSFFSRYGAYIIAAAVFTAIACIYCLPSLRGDIVNAGDTANYRGMVHEIQQFQHDTGEDSFWTGSMFCGMPTMQIGGSKYKSAVWLKPLRSILLAGHKSTNTPAILLLYLVCFYIMLRCFNIDRWVSIAGAAAIALSSYFIIIIPAGHISKTSAIALMAVVAGGFHLIFRKKYGLGSSLVMLATATGFSNHPQMSYYICMMIGVMFVGEVFIHIRERRVKDLGIASLLFAASLALGLGANSASIFANKEYVTQTMRGGHSDIVHDTDTGENPKGLKLDYATQWSYGIDESLSFMIPGIMGGASSMPVSTDSKLYQSMVKKGIDSRTAAQICQNVPLYWGEQPFTAGNVYMGATICFLFVLGLIIVKGPYKWALAVATLFSIMLAWGYHFMPLTEFFFKYFPMYSKFRAVSSILIVAEIAMPLLGFIAVRDIMNGTVGKRQAISGIYMSAGITAGICLIMAIAGKHFFSFTGISDQSLQSQLPDFIFNGIIDERKALLVKDSLRSALFILLTAAVIWVYTNSRMKAWGLALLLGVLILADLWPIDRRYFNEGNYISARQSESRFDLQPYEKQILTDKDPHFRVLNLASNTFNDSRTSYYLKSLGGYHAAKLRRYQDLIDEHLSKMNMDVISMLNAKYIITPGKDGQPTPLRNTGAMGNAWYVDTLAVVDNANQESDALNTINLHTTAVLDKEFSEFALQKARHHDDSAYVRLTKYTPRYIDYESFSNENGTIVFSEIYYPFGWKAEIDGVPAEHFRANYTLRALNVPAGKHQIHFEFNPESIQKGNIISTVCAILMYAVILLIIISAIRRSVRTKRLQ